jgi:hypothetical protein
MSWKRSEFGAGTEAQALRDTHGAHLAVLLGVNESSRAELSQPLATCKLPWLRAVAALVPPSKASPSQAAARAGAVFFRARLRGVVIISAATL